MAHNITIITLNVKGINHVVKRHKILSSLKKDRVPIALLQETHLTDSEHLKLKRDWVGQIYYSSFNSKSRGVAKLIHKNLPFTLNTIVRDTDGRFILITGLLYGEQILLASVYAPNTFDRLFYSNLLAKTSSVCPNHVIIGGDFNCGLSPETDYPPKSQPPSKMAKATMDFCSDLGLFDTWRLCNPHVKDFTFFSHPHFSLSRIDYILLSIDLADLPLGVRNNFILMPTLKVWHNIAAHVRRRGFSSALQPLIRNKAFLLGIDISIFDDWCSKNIRFICDLFERGGFMAFNQVQIKYNLPQKHFFGFLQVRHF
uniref:exodeoxyribonuclease III n=1 Tax=Neolamprologus brichardi TaxID=32507 RepID=A0A3Q4HJU4_NEOBR